MSAHRLSASGERPYTLNAGGGSFSAFQVPSKREDGFTFTASGFSKVEIPLTGGARVETRRVKQRGRDEREWFLDVPVLVIGNPEEGQTAGYVTVYGSPGGEGPDPGPENTNMDVRRPSKDGLPYLKGEIVEVTELEGQRESEPDA